MIWSPKKFEYPIDELLSGYIISSQSVHLKADVLRLSLCGLRGLVERGGLLLTLLVLPTAMVTNRNESEVVRGWEVCLNARRIKDLAYGYGYLT